MYARVATFEDAKDIDGVVEGIRNSDGPPEGLKSRELHVLADRSSGKVVMVAMFETEEDMHAGHELLNGMSPPSGDLGTRAGVVLTEVVAHMKMD